MLIINDLGITESLQQEEEQLFSFSAALIGMSHVSLTLSNDYMKHKKNSILEILIAQNFQMYQIIMKSLVAK